MVLNSIISISFFQISLESSKVEIIYLSDGFSFIFPSKQQPNAWVLLNVFGCSSYYVQIIRHEIN